MTRPSNRARTERRGFALELAKEEQHIALAGHVAAGRRVDPHRRVGKGRMPTRKGRSIVELVVRIPAEHNVAEFHARLESKRRTCCAPCICRASPRRDRRSRPSHAKGRASPRSPAPQQPSLPVSHPYHSSTTNFCILLTAPVFTSARTAVDELQCREIALIWNVPQCLYNHGNEIADRQNRSNVTRDFGKRLDDPVAAFAPVPFRANAMQFLGDPEFGTAPPCAPQNPRRH